MACHFTHYTIHYTCTIFILSRLAQLTQLLFPGMWLQYYEAQLTNLTVFTTFIVYGLYYIAIYLCSVAQMHVYMQSVYR